MQALGSVERDAAADLLFGQLVIIVARYFLIAGVLGVLLWDISEPADMAAAVAPMAGFLAINFFLHARYLSEEPASFGLTALAGVVDLLLITSVILAWPGNTGLESSFFVLYYPAIVAFAFVTPRGVEAAYTALAIILYVGVVLLVDSIDGVTGVTMLKTLILRVITLAATGGIAYSYWRTVRVRRSATSTPQTE